MDSRSRLRRGLLCVGLLFAMAGDLAAADDPFQPVRERIGKSLVETNAPSIAVAVAKEGKIIWEQGFGWADRENRVPATEHTLYSLASISKPITATGLMVLVERKSLELDKPANDYLGEAKLRARVGDAAEATLRRVANHTSGLPLHYQFFYADQEYRPPVRDETIRRYGNLVTVPGERFQYSNLGYGVLDYVIERTSGKKYADFMREEVFLPLGMTHTSVNVGPGLEAHQAIRYTPEGTRIPFYDFDHPGASAVYASAHDLVRFATFHLKEHLADQRAILKDETIDEMQKFSPNPREGSGYGVGWGIGEVRGHRVVRHTGGMPGVSTVCTLVPDQRLAVVVLCNTGAPLPHELSEMILKLLLEEKKPPELGLRREPDATSGSFTPDSRLLGKWEGKLATWQGDLPLAVTFKDSGDVHIKLGRQLETLLNNPRFVNDILTGVFAGHFDHPDARGRPYRLNLQLTLRGDVLNGACTATTLPDGRGSNAVTQWLELKRNAPSDAAPPASGGGQ